jgi:RNA polymerase sigma-70 factor (ECF subfamily)
MQDELIQQARAGDAAAFQQVVNDYNPLVWRVVRTLLADRTLVEDIVQDAWLDAWCGLPHFDPRRPFRPWLLTIVANRCRMSNRRRRPHIQTLDDSHLGLSDKSADVTDAMIRSETDAELTAALMALPREQRHLVELRYFVKLEIAEITMITGVPAGTVKSRISRTLVKLRQHLDAPDWTGGRKEAEA